MLPEPEFINLQSCRKPEDSHFSMWHRCELVTSLSAGATLCQIQYQTANNRRNTQANPERCNKYFNQTRSSYFISDSPAWSPSAASFALCTCICSTVSSILLSPQWNYSQFSVLSDETVGRCWCLSQSCFMLQHRMFKAIFMLLLESLGRHTVCF